MKRIVYAGYVALFLSWNFASICIADTDKNPLPTNSEELYQLLSKSYDDKLYGLLDKIDKKSEAAAIPALEKLINDYEKDVRIAGLHEANNYGRAYVIREKLKCMQLQGDLQSCLMGLLDVHKKSPLTTHAIYTEALSQLEKIGDEKNADVIKVKLDNALGYETYLKIKIRNLNKEKKFEYLMGKMKDPELKLYERIATTEVAAKQLDPSEGKKMVQEFKDFKKEDVARFKGKKKEIAETFVRAIRSVGGEKELQELDQEDVDFLRQEEDRVKHMNRSMKEEKK